MGNDRFARCNWKPRRWFTAYRDIRSKHDNSTRSLRLGWNRPDETDRRALGRIASSGSREKIRSTLLFDVLPLLFLFLSLSRSLLGHCSVLVAPVSVPGKTNAFQEGEETGRRRRRRLARSFDRVLALAYTGRIVTHTSPASHDRSAL